MQVGFRPTAPGARSGILAIKSDDPTTPSILIPLSGTALPSAPQLEMSPTSLDFGLQPFGLPSDPQRVTVTNTGAVPLTITSVTVTGTEFAIVQGCTTGPLGALGFRDNWCAIDVRFSPSSGGPRTGQITIVSDDPRGPITVPLSGTGPLAAVSVAPASITFGSVEIGLTSNERQVFVNNTGTAPLTVTGATTTGSAAGDFALRSPLPCTAPPQGRCTLAFAFSPHASGNRAAQVAIATSVAGPAPGVALMGFGVLFTQTPPPPLPADDHRFVALSSPNTCAENGQTLTIPIPVTRVIGPGPTAVAVAAGTLSASATLELMAFDTASSGTHQMSMNGTAFGVIGAATGGWSLRTVTMPIALLAFPTQGMTGAAPVPATNVVRISPDVTHVGRCVAVAWARLSFLALSPVILVHGNGSNGAFFARRGFVGALNAAGIPSDSSINLAGGGGAPIATNAMTLQAMIPPIVRSFGVNSVHVVAHSKGGLDARLWLSTSAAANATPSATRSGFRVLSLTTLSTPHQGSALADLALGVEATGIGLFAFTVANLRSLGLSNAATPDLTTFAASAFNPPLPTAVDYRMLGGDIDRSGNLAVDSAPVDEYLAARAENGDLAGIFGMPPFTVGTVTVTGPQMADALATALYRTLWITRTVVVVSAAIVVPTFLVPGLEFLPPLVVVTVRSPVPIPGPAAPNDLLVTIPSAMGAPAPFVAPFPAFTGPIGRDHGSIANGGVAAAVIPFLITTDITRGDLR